jgi:predicted HAD superfamily Cof-like phosphohydrolase
MTATLPDLLGQALKFREIMGQPSGRFHAETLRTQAALIEEESVEFLDAHLEAIYNKQNIRAREAALKELADLVYVAFQYAAAAGWELDVALDRVHKSNLSKLVDGKPLKREDGKVLKGPNYQPANLIDLV